MRGQLTQVTWSFSLVQLNKTTSKDLFRVLVLSPEGLVLERL